jgi:hypothetical protein
MTAMTSAAPTSTGGAPTARVTGSNRHPGAAARGGAERVVSRHRKSGCEWCPPQFLKKRGNMSDHSQTNESTEAPEALADVKKGTELGKS